MLHIRMIRYLQPHCENKFIWLCLHIIPSVVLLMHYYIYSYTMRHVPLLLKLPHQLCFETFPQNIGYHAPIMLQNWKIDNIIISVCYYMSILGPQSFLPACAVLILYNNYLRSVPTPELNTNIIAKSLDLHHCHLKSKLHG